jgi:hypothetical protein
MPGQTMHPIFIVGVGRSGTTLLANLLGSHPELSPIYETQFLKNLLLLCDWVIWYRGNSISRRLSALTLNSLWRKRFLAKCDKYRSKCADFRNMIASMPSREDLVAQRIKQPYESFRFEDTHILFDGDRFIDRTDQFLADIGSHYGGADQVYTLARGYVNDLFQEHCQREGKPHWINKTPRLLLCLEGLYALFPTARCIHIVRDGRDVVASNLSLSWGPENVRDAARRWKKRLAGRSRVDPARQAFLEVRYEDLIQAPRETLADIFAFLGLSADVDEILKHFKIYDQRVGAWRTALDARSRKAFADEAGDMLANLGYEKDRSWVHVE